MSFNSLKRSSRCLAKREFASVKVATTPRSVAVAVTRLAKAQMVASEIWY
jgi:hypothetical protein